MVREVWVQHMGSAKLLTLEIVQYSLTHFCFLLCSCLWCSTWMQCTIFQVFFLWSYQMIICSPSAFQTSTNEKKRNFVETVEAHVTLGVDPRRGDQVCMLLCSLLFFTWYYWFCFAPSKIELCLLLFITLYC